MLAWVITKFWRMGFPNLSAGYFILDIALIAEFLRQWRRTRLPLFRNLLFLHLCFPIVHVVGMAFDTSAYFLGAQRSDYWMQAFMRNRIFDLILLYLMAFGASRIWLRNNPAARERLRKKIKDLEDRVRLAASRLLAFFPLRRP